MKSVGIREAKARLSELARAAAKGEAAMLTDHGKPIATMPPSSRRPRERAGLTREVPKACFPPYHLDVRF